MAGFRNYINFTDVLGDKGDVSSSRCWSLSIDSWPSSVYQMPDKVWHTRLTTCVPPADPAIANLHEPIHGHMMVQPGDVDYSGTLQCTFQDFVDQSVMAGFMQWRSKIMDPETRNSLNKADLLADMTLYQLDRQLNPIKRWTMKHGILEAYDAGESYGGENTNLGKISVAIFFEHVVQSLLNL